MSLFLGKIHYWLYNKILLVNTRTEVLVNNLKIEYPQQIEEIWQYTLENTSPPLDHTKDLSVLIDANNIHNWLASQITNAQMREAIFINECLVNLPTTALTFIKQLFIADAKNLAAMLIANNHTTNYNAPALYAILNDYLLNGMPCDSEDKIEQENSTYISWLKNPCSKLELWRNLNISIVTMQELYFAWINSFIKTLKPQALLLKTATGLAIKIEK